MGITLSEAQIERYSRQIILSEVGGVGQRKLLQSKVLIIGCGGLGSPCAYYLAAAGVGTIGLVDGDKVELNNLQRQILHSTNTVGKLKVESGKETLLSLNPDIQVITYPFRLTSENILDIIKHFDIIVDGTDNFPSRYLINDACVMTNKPFFHAAILKFFGQAMTIIPHQGPCYRCFFSEPPPPGMVPSCQEAGVLGAIAGIMGVIQATEVLKFILGKGALLTGNLLIVDALEMNFTKHTIMPKNDCAVCGDNPSITKLIDYEEFCGLRAQSCNTALSKI